ncbi:MAG: 4-(cytidine 5'-diphospho)-2-C-methyl-D-erythritol kinase [Actinomycetes bacterium]
MSRSVTVRVPAKINVYLGVGPRNSDGFHDVATVFQALSVYDEVTVTQSDSLQIFATGKLASLVPLDSSNLAWKAALAVAQASSVEPHVHITINKSIPVAAGLAGGSADAAATIVACNILWGNLLTRDQVDEIARQLGSDVPFMMHGGVALGSGRGDNLSPVMTRGSFHWVLATFTQGLSTPEMYSRLDQQRGLGFQQAPEVPQDVMFALARGDINELGKALHNDLQSAALAARPSLHDVLDFGRDNGALGALVSGSGPTCAFLVENESKAIDLVVAFSSSGLVDSVIHAHGPVHGAREVPE